MASPVIDRGIADKLDDEGYATSLAYLAKEARTDFRTFCLLVNPPKEDGQGIVISECHYYIIDMIQGMADGTSSYRKSLSMPPQHGKSTFATILALAWLMGRMENFHFAVTCFSDTLVKRFSKQAKAIVQGLVWRMVFPDVTVDPSFDKESEWRLTNDNWLRTGTAGSKLTGNRVDWLIIDDPHAGREEANSKLKRSRVVQWYYGDCISRLTPWARVMLIGTRWHPQDLIGSVTNVEQHEKNMEEFGADDDEFEVVNLPAICENEDMDPLGRKAGDALFPEVRDVNFLKRVKSMYERAGTAYEWDSQFQGRPKISGGGVADVSKIPKISIDQVPEGLEWVRGYDLAASEKQIADYTVGAKLAYDPKMGNLYIINMKRNQLAWPKNEKLIVALGKKERIRVRIEAVAGFLTCYQTVKKKLEGHCIVTKTEGKGDKLMRANRWLPFVEAGKLFIVEDDSWNQAFKDELETFPVGEHDDMVDAVSIAWEMLDYLAKKKEKEEERNDPNRARKRTKRRAGRASRLAVAKTEEVVQKRRRSRVI